MRCILIRHAATPGNESRMFLGSRTDESLSDTGVKSILEQRTGLRGLIDENVSVWSSPMKRAMETAGLIFPVSKVNICPDLRELDFGIMDGHTHSELDGNPAYQAWIDAGGLTDPPEGEAISVFLKRSLDALLKILSTEPLTDKAVICHGGNIMAVMSSLFGGGFYDYIVPNLDGYILKVETDGKGISVPSYDGIGSRLHIGSDHR